MSKYRRFFYPRITTFFYNKLYYKGLFHESISLSDLLITKFTHTPKFNIAYFSEKQKYLNRP